MTSPDLFHLPGLPLLVFWSWMKTVSPIERGGRAREPIRSLSSILPCRLAMALARRSASSRHSRRGWYLLYWPGMWSLRSRPKMTWAGLTPVTGSGLFGCMRRALVNLSVLQLPPGPKLSITSRLADFTATSDLLLALG